LRRRSDVHRRRCRGSFGATPNGWAATGPPRRIALAYARASRPKPAKLVTNLVLRGKVEADLAKKYSPEQIAGRLKVDFPDQPEMQVSTETIYQSLYVQSRGALKRDLPRHPTIGSVKLRS
jgi:IS30 family transposase